MPKRAAQPSVQNTPQVKSPINSGNQSPPLNRRINNYHEPDIGESQNHEETPVASKKSPLPSKKSRNQSPIQGPPKYSNKEDSSNPSQLQLNSKLGRVREQQINIRAVRSPKSKSKPSHPSQPEVVEFESSQPRGKLMVQMKVQQDLQGQKGENDTYQQQKIKNLHANMEKLSESLLDLRENYEMLEQEEKHYSQIKNNSQIHMPKGQKFYVEPEKIPKKKKSPRERAEENTQQILNRQKSDPQKKEEILKFLLQKQREKEERRKKVQQDAQRASQKIKKQIQQKEKQQQQFKQWRMKQQRQANKFQEKRKKYREFEQKRKKAVEQFEAKNKNQKKDYLYQLKKKKLEQQLDKQYQEQKQKEITERKQIYKPINQQELEQHGKWFQAKRTQIEQAKRLMRENDLQMIQQRNNNLPEFWHGSAHDLIEQERGLIKQKLKEPFVRAQKMKDYKQYIQGNFLPRNPKPKVSSASRVQDFIDPNKYREIKRYRYYKGVSYGQISETKPLPRDSSELKRIGDGYMQFVKKLPKRRSASPNQLVSSFTPQPQRKFDMHYVRNLFSSVIENEKERKLRVEMPQNVRREELSALMGKLKSEGQRVFAKQMFVGGSKGKEKDWEGGKEVTDGLITNIERKLSLLSQM